MELSRPIDYLTSAPPSVLEESETLMQRASTRKLELIRSLKAGKKVFYKLALARTLRQTPESESETKR